LTITYPLSLPSTPVFNSFTLRRRSTVGVSSSPYTGQQQVYAWSGQWWEADCELPPMNREDAAEWRAFLAALNGREGTFLMGDPTAATPRGAIGGTPLANGAAAVGDKTIDIDGCTAGVMGWLKAGDFLQIGSGLNARLYMNLQDVNSDGSGQATLDIWPAIRLGVADNDPIIVTNAKGLFRLSDNSTQDTAQPSPLFSFQFTAVEAI
jgi:hypothetical protein